MRDLKRPAAETVATQQLHLARVAPGPGLQCTCRGDVGDQRSDADRDAHEGVAELTGVVYRSFCAETQSLSCEAAAETTAAADEPPVASAAPSGACHASCQTGGPPRRGGDDAQPRRLPLQKVVLLETPMLVVGATLGEAVLRRAVGRLDGCQPTRLL